MISKNNKQKFKVILIYFQFFAIGLKTVTDILEGSLLQ